MARALQRVGLPHEGYTRLLEVQDNETKDLFADINDPLGWNIYM